MKNKFLRFLFMSTALGVLATALLGQKTLKANAALGDVGIAEYVTIEQAPIIDGIKDSIWTETVELCTDENDCDARGKVSVLWNEMGLYFYARVTDLTTNATDRCNFWVLETYSRGMVSELGYPEISGAYYLCLNPNGENQYYLPSSIEPEKYVDMRGKYQASTQVYEDGYAIEVYVQLTGDSPLKKGEGIGFNVSIDDYQVEGGERESYSYWNAIGAYWMYPSTLAEVKLFDLVSEVSSNVNSDEILQPSNKNNNLNGCSGSSAITSSITLLVGVVLLSRKKN